jgi:hypothetical protein
VLTHAFAAALVAVVSVSTAPPPPVERPPVITRPAATTIVLAAQLVDEQSSEVFGGAIYKEAKVAPGTLFQSLAVTVKGQEPDTVLAITIDGRTVGSLRTDRDGAGTAGVETVSTLTVTRTSPLPLVRPGAVIRIGTTKGAFGAKPA